MAQERKVGTLGVMALLSLPLVSMGFSVVTPAMATPQFCSNICSLIA